MMTRALSAPTPVAENVKAFSPDIVAIQVQRIARILARFLFRASALELAEFVELVLFNRALKGNVPDSLFRYQDPSATELDPSSLAENLGFVEAYFAGLDEFMSHAPRITSQEWAGIDQDVCKRSANLPVIAKGLVAAAKAAKLSPALASFASAREASTLNAAQNAARRKGMPTIDESMAANVNAGLVVEEDDSDDEDGGSVPTSGAATGLPSLTGSIAALGSFVGPSVPVGSATWPPGGAGSGSGATSAAAHDAGTAAAAAGGGLSSAAATIRMRQQMRMQTAGSTALSVQANRAKALRLQREEAERARKLEEQQARKEKQLAQAAIEHEAAQATAKAKEEEQIKLRRMLEANAEEDDYDDGDDYDEEEANDDGVDNGDGEGLSGIGEDFVDVAQWGGPDSQGSGDRRTAEPTEDAFLGSSWDDSAPT